MKKFSSFVVMLALLSMTACNQNDSKADSNSAQSVIETPTATKPSEVFEAFAENFSTTASFAYANVDGHEALLVSHETFGNNQNDEVEAIDATIFVLDPDGKIMTLGSIRSQGTLYPVSVLDGKLMVAGHQFVRIYGIRGDVPELVLDCYKEGEGQEMTEMFETFEKGTPVKFQKSLKD